MKGARRSSVKTHQFKVSNTIFEARRLDLVPQVSHAHFCSTLQVPQKYRLIRPIGTGAYGVVISALDTDTGKKARFTGGPARNRSSLCARVRRVFSRPRTS